MVVAMAPGMVLLDRYRLVVRIGRGGMGEVYRADDLDLGQSVALKFLPAEVAADAARLAMLRAEVAAARQVAHPNVCRVFDIARTDIAGSPIAFLCMEYVDGSDLSSLLERIGRFPGEKAAEIGRQMCFGLAAVHDAGFVHRDMKPSNVLLDGRGKAPLADFGLASPSVAESMNLAGTPRYMAPEVLAGERATRQ
jgi:serine/threonine-protein kinase